MSTTTELPPVSLSDISEAAGLSKATVSYVLHNKRGPSPETRVRVLQIAEQLGYRPDARVISYMATVRNATAKQLLPIAWVNTNWEKGAWENYKFLSPYFEGASARCLELGYRLEKIWAAEPGISMRRIAQIIYQRGIEATIVTHGFSHIRLRWENLASVSLESALLAPRLSNIMSDTTYNIYLALKMTRRQGYRRIGICLDSRVGRSSYNMARAAVGLFHASVAPAEILPPFYFTRSKHEQWPQAMFSREFPLWLKQHRPDVVVCHDNHMVKYLEGLGYRVPEDIGVVHIATDDDVSDWAGINSRRREIGASAADTVISLLQNRRFGVPKLPLEVRIRGTWHNGRTLLVPKPKDKRRR
jgi:LacI family transcriptional regulator